MIRRRPSPVASPLFLLGLALSVGTARAEERKDREFKECADCPVMVGIPAGSFVMGSPPSESGRFDTEGPQHKVAIKAFALGKYDITSEQFLAFLRDTGYQPAPCNPLLDMGWRSPGRGKAYPPYDADAPHWPAVCLDWRDAKRYVEWLNDEGPQRAPEHRARARPLSPAERSRMGICRARRHHDGALVGRRDRHRQGQLQWLRQRVGQAPARRCRCLRAERLRALRHAGQCLAVDRGLLARDL